MINKYCISLAIASLFCCEVVFSQNFQEDFDQINKAYRNAEEFSCEIIYSLFGDYETTEIMEVGKSEIKKKGNKYYTKILSLESVINERYVVMLDHDSKVLMIDAIKPDQFKWTRQMSMDLDSLLSPLGNMFGEEKPIIDNTEYFKLDLFKGSYVVHYNRGDYQKLEIEFNQKTKEMVKVVLYYREAVQFEDNQRATKPRVEMVYKNFDVNPNLSEEDFSENKYLRILPNGELAVKKDYSDYTVINHLLNRWEEQPDN